ncbi:hypothetical protein O1611_g6288 [Lasiodiplodia mahajangana]|uniref:Uncharacterized protein n=1 Tax=Lasiodiplodia mahajangana TaxID=1108764 RepID=A0ACC2JJ91_9PEZI|nr:hypothetical protein O1611_g6288 [Lasiodiplodia mahajangana]
MPPTNSCGSLKLREDSLPPPNLHITTPKSPRIAGSDSSDTASISGSSASASSNDEDNSWIEIDRLLLPLNWDSRKATDKNTRQIVNRPIDTLETGTAERGDVDGEARHTHLAWESFQQWFKKSVGGSIFGDGRGKIMPLDSMSMRHVYRKPYMGAPDDEHSDDGSVCLDIRTKKPKYEDRVTRLGYVERFPDTGRMRHYRFEAKIDKAREEGMVRTTLGTINMPVSKLEILNGDGLQPKLASDLDMYELLEAFNNGFLEIKKSPVAGYGVFAVRDLEPFTTILIERELFKANSFDLYQRLEALTEEQKKAYYDLHGYMRTQSEDIRAAIWRTNRYV